MKIKFIYLILFIFYSCTLFRDRKDLIKTLPGNWNLTIINKIDTLRGNAKFEFKKIDENNSIRNYEFRSNLDSIFSKGSYTIYGIKSSTYLNLDDATSNLKFNGEMTELKYQSEERLNEKSISYIEFIDTLKNSNNVIKLQLTRNLNAD